MNRDLERITRTYRAFHHRAPQHAVYSNFRDRLPRAVWRLGVTEFIGYMTHENGRAELYVHEFAPGSAPFIYAGPDRSQLYLVGGRFVVTGRGVTDLSARGTVVDLPRRWKVVRIKQRAGNWIPVRKRRRFR